jgi:hypothetical protein
MKAFYLFVCLLLFSFSSSAQFNQLILRKNGIAQKRYSEGSVITIQTKLGLKYSGTIYLIQNDSIYFSGGGIHKNDIVAVFKNSGTKGKIIPFSKEAFLYANAGIPLFTAGLVISGQPFVTSLIAGVTLVYAPILFYNIKRIITNGSRRYSIGKKYDLQVLDLYRAEKLPNQIP